MRMHLQPVPFTIMPSSAVRTAVCAERDPHGKIYAHPMSDAEALPCACVVNGQQELPIDGHEISPLADTRTPRRRTGFLPSGRSSDQRLHPLPGESLF